MHRLKGRGAFVLVMSGALLAGSLLASRPASPAPSRAEIGALGRGVVEAIGPLREPLRPAAALVAPAPLAGAAAPTALNAGDVVLQAGDVGPDFVLAASGDRLQSGVSVRTQRMVRADRSTAYVEPDGIVGVRSFAAVLPSPARADQAFDEIAADLFAGSQELPLPPIGDRTRGAVQWSDDPFGGAGKAILFRSKSVVGGVLVGVYDQPTGLDDVVPLVQIMVARAGQ